MSYNTLLFVCALCQREVRDYPNRNGRDRALEPICRYCEGAYTQRIGGLKNGAFMDRRKARQIAALAEALGGEAYSRDWESKHVRA